MRRQLFLIAMGCALTGWVTGCNDHQMNDLVIPDGLQLNEPEEARPKAPTRLYADDEVFAAALADPKGCRPMLEEVQALNQRVFGERHDLAVAYFEKNRLWKVCTLFCGPDDKPMRAFRRTYWAGDQFCEVCLQTRSPFMVDCDAVWGCLSPEDGRSAALTDLHAELLRVDALKDGREIDGILPRPKKYVPPVKPDFKLINGFQEGIYRYQATVSPGEDGEVFLRAYEVTKGIRLSALRMKRCTLEKVEGKGEQLIGIGKEFTIYEGDPGHYYAARLEIWFKPAGGGSPRKLKEKLFRVQGWSF